jgi:hypothetical protein
MYDYESGQFFVATDLQQPTSTANIVRLYDNEDSDIPLAFSTLVLRTASGGGGTLLVEDTDYTIETLDDYYTAKEGINIYRGFQIINVAYQGITLYASGNILGGYSSKNYIDTKVSSDTIWVEEE